MKIINKRLTVLSGVNAIYIKKFKLFKRKINKYNQKN